MAASFPSRALRRRRERGVLLIEALIAITIFSIGILAILGVVAKMSVGSSDARYRVEAAQFAESIMAEMRVADKTTRNAAYAFGGARYAYWTGRISTAGSLPLVNAAAGTTPLAVAFDAKTVTVTISWRAPQDKDVDSSGQALSHKYVTTSVLQ